ncbi:MAG: hypothetical protein RL394_1441 [Bacteroidota bacterium]
MKGQVKIQLIQQKETACIQLQAVFIHGFAIP